MNNHILISFTSYPYPNKKQTQIAKSSKELLLPQSKNVLLG